MMIHFSKSIVCSLSTLAGICLCMSSCGGGGDSVKQLSSGEVLELQMLAEGAGTLRVTVTSPSAGVVYFAGTKIAGGSYIGQAQQAVSFLYREPEGGTPGLFNIDFMIDKDYHIHPGPVVVNRIMRCAIVARIPKYDFTPDRGDFRSTTVKYDFTQQAVNDAVPAPVVITNQDGYLKHSFPGGSSLNK